MVGKHEVDKGNFKLSFELPLAVARDRAQRHLTLDLSYSKTTDGIFPFPKGVSP